MACSRFAFRSSSLRRTGSGLNSPDTVTVVPLCGRPSALVSLGMEVRETDLARGLAFLALDLACALELDYRAYGGFGGGCGGDGDRVGEGAEGGEGFAAEAEGGDGLEVGEGGELGGVVFECLRARV